MACPVSTSYRMGNGIICLHHLVLSLLGSAWYAGTCVPHVGRVVSSAASLTAWLYLLAMRLSLLCSVAHTVRSVLLHAMLSTSWRATALLSYVAAYA